MNYFPLYSTLFHTHKFVGYLLQIQTDGTNTMHCIQCGNRQLIGHIQVYMLIYTRYAGYRPFAGSLKDI